VIAVDFAVRPGRDLVVVEGADAATYLQGQLSQDVAALAVGDDAWSLVLQPQGKVDAWFRVARVADDRFELDVDAGFGEALVARLSRFLIRTKATVELVETGVLRGSGDEAARISAGVPAMGAELDDRTIPAEVGQWFIDASVSFTKGCYTGQELVARVDSRGSNVPRHLRVLQVEGAEAVPVGAEVVHDGAVVGQVTSSADGVALAYVKRSVQPPATVEVRWDTATATATATIA
jgi:folate-binding protein YgfZ